MIAGVLAKLGSPILLIGWLLSACCPWPATAAPLLRPGGYVLREQAERNFDDQPKPSAWTGQLRHLPDTWRISDPNSLCSLAQLKITHDDLQALRMIVATLMYWALSMAGYRLCHLRLRGLLPLLHGLTLLTIAVALTLILRHQAADRIWLLTWPLLSLRLLLIALLLKRGWQQRSGHLAALGLTALLWQAAIVQSHLFILQRLPWDSFRLNLIGAIPFCLAALYYCAVTSPRNAETYRRDLHAAVNAERARILQDVHDGMGAQLITALHLARREDGDRRQLARHIEEAIEDLRLIIDSLDITEQDLLPLLGNLRYRLAPRLHALNIELAWHVSPIPPLNYLTPGSALSVLRIVQEAINNALQHAHPSRITVSVQRIGGQIVISVSDNGHGGVADMDSAGRGLRGMRARADKLGGQLDIASGGQGTEVKLSLPLLAVNAATRR
jgi:signal transduction histidine kinase